MASGKTLEVYIMTECPNWNDPSKLSTGVRQAQAIFNGHCSDLEVLIHIIKCDYKNTTCNGEYLAVAQALHAAKDHSYVIVCKDTSVSSISASLLLQHINEVITTEKNFDVMWLAKWLDQCTKLSGKRLVGDRGMYVADTHSPHGVQCLLFSPEGRVKVLSKENLPHDVSFSHILNRAVAKGTLRAITFQPCPISFDVSRATTPVDYTKTCECADPPGPIKPDKPGSNIGVFIFIVIGVLIAVMIFLLFRFGNAMSAKYDAAAAKAGAGTGAAPKP